MIEAIVSGEILKTISRAIVALVSECRIHFLNKGLHSRAVDPSNVAMVIVDVPKESMESYRVDEEKVIGVDMNRIFEISKTMTVKDLVELSVQDETNLRIKFGAVEYNLALIDPSAIRKEPKIPELNLPAKIVLDAKEFKRAISASEKISENVILRSDKNSFTIEAKGDVEKITFTMTGSELIEFNGGEARSMFSLDYLKEFCKIAGAGDLLTIYLGTNYPGRFSFELVGGKVRVEYILAPRVES
ncbi:MAG: DNA polymerase sliding clamp [Archaeoglobi archaeon]|jgi:proliferating cell nuclear antigen|nr:DNA polymerase sliding clamp [Archaeoglobus sp.]NHW88200.1 DNA polymerase sliding clamp [Archaeoglobales archaeon]TDA24968.1 MAG: DNA polymerase sliding clamp [Archaeoglobi archaeon]TDA25085.1 MAG: DNA polymerase sliding clamp [Archaeoglobi archaeon]